MAPGDESSPLPAPLVVPFVLAPPDPAVVGEHGSVVVVLGVAAVELVVDPEVVLVEESAAEEGVVVLVVEVDVVEVDVLEVDVVEVDSSEAVVEVVEPDVEVVEVVELGEVLEQGSLVEVLEDPGTEDVLEPVSDVVVEVDVELVESSA